MIKMTERAQTLIDALSETPDKWVSRAELVRRIGRNGGHFYPAEIEATSWLRLNNIIEERIARSETNKLTYEYRIKS